MLHIISENLFDEWVLCNALDAQRVVVELVWRLVAASSPRPTERRFPLWDSLGQPGPDGILDVDVPFNPFVPQGRSFWEIGTNEKAGAKATSDYKGLVRAIPESVRRNSTFVFVTPRSGWRNWPHTWKEGAQAKWLETRRKRIEWKDIRVIDGTKLIDWLHQFPPVELWLAKKLGLPAEQIETPEQRWNVLRTIGEPPPLSPHVFLANRDEASTKLREVLAGTSIRLRLDTYFPDQLADFVAACVAAMDEESRVDAMGRCLVISGTDGWDNAMTLREPHVLIANFHLDEVDPSGTRLLARARRAGHAVVYAGTPGGVPDPNRVPLPSPKSYQIKEALEKAGYKEERARSLAQKSGGNFAALLRCLENLSVMPGWAQETEGSDLAIASLLGSWNEDSEADRLVVETLSRKAYGELIGKVREAALRPGTPLTQREGAWKFVPRYEGWYSLGLRLFDEHLDRFRAVASSVLSERSPEFDLPMEQRHAAGVYNKLPAHSTSLRNGLANSLALLGAHSRALTSCSLGKAEATAALAVREILKDADWILWASLRDVTPLLAEAAPGEFLDAVEAALRRTPCPFDELFAQETPGVFGANYMTGILWALEALAWDAAWLTRVVMALGELAALDPGGNWGNRPANSLSTILLPWLPQTCAPAEKRKAAVTILLNELPDVGWRLLLSLLPTMHSASTRSARPSWRVTIPEDWHDGVTHEEYREQVAAYAKLAIRAAEGDIGRLVALIERLDDLPTPAQELLLAYLQSKPVVLMPEVDRLRLWNGLVDLSTKHRKFADARWAMRPEQIDRIAAVAEGLAPVTRALGYRRLFSEREFDLYEENGNFEEQQKRLEEHRQKAIEEIATANGVQSVIAFAQSVESPSRVGFSFGVVANTEADHSILPGLLDTEQDSLTEFARGYIWSRFETRGWSWVDGTKAMQWSSAQKGNLLSCLPFAPDTWVRSSRLLGEDESPYWTKANVNPYQGDNGLELAIDQLIKYGRPYAAIACLDALLHGKQPVNRSLAVRALLTGPGSAADIHTMDVYHIVEVIKALQDDPNVNGDDLIRVEWTYLPLLDEYRGASPKTLERRLADNPEFFSEVIRAAFRSSKAEKPTESPHEHDQRIATNAYLLLSKWRTAPGLLTHGTFSGEVLIDWLKRVKAICEETGHLEIALTMVGHVLTHAPSDPDGLWLHRSVAVALNAKDAEDMRNGFQTELFNSRGVHSWTAGQEERSLAKDYLTKADEVEAHGYHRLATSLRELAASYERHSEQQASRDPFED